MLLLITSLVLVGWTHAQSCQPFQRRFSFDPTICKPRNPNFNFIQEGINDPKQIDLILKVHNAYRSRVAMGQEHNGGGMPKAANMMQMVWDPELASVAQRWAENCIYKHDCRECRQVENFPVGQNIAYRDFWCSGSNCVPQKNEDIPDWPETLKLFYDEVIDFDSKDVDHFKPYPTKEIGHFTQMIWANTWRLGCGYAFFYSGKAKRHFFVCNYGPAGNDIDSPIYQKGTPCSGCPSNSCCGQHCKGGEKYSGLCRMLDINSAPIYLQKLKGLTFYCGFEHGNADCKTSATGNKNWVTKSTLSGNIHSIQLNGGEETHLEFATMIRKENVFCLRIQFRKGPAVMGNVDNSLLSITFNQGYRTFTMNLDLTSNEFSSYSLDLFGDTETKFTINFSVSPGGNLHILDIKDIVAFPGKCNSRKTDGKLGFPV